MLPTSEKLLQAQSDVCQCRLCNTATKHFLWSGKIANKTYFAFSEEFICKKTMTMQPVDFPLIHSSSTLAGLVSVSLSYLEIVETFRDGLFVGYQPAWWPLAWRHFGKAASEFQKDFHIFTRFNFWIFSQRNGLSSRRMWSLSENMFKMGIWILNFSSRWQMESKVLFFVWGKAAEV